MHFKHACIASVMTLLLTLWLFGFQLQAEGIGLTVVNQLGTNGPALLIGVAIVFFFQLFRERILGVFGQVGARTPKLVLPSKSDKPGLYRLGTLLILGALIVLPFNRQPERGRLGDADPDLCDAGAGSQRAGRSGRLADLGYVGFYAVGAYSYALLNQYWFQLLRRCRWPDCWPPDSVSFLGFPVLRLRGDYLAIVTLALVK